MVGIVYASVQTSQPFSLSPSLCLLRFFPIAILLLCLLAGSVSAQSIQSEKEEFRVEIVADGLDVPWGMVELPDGRLLVTERKGELRIIENGKLDPKAITNFPPIFARGQGGLLDIELHPDFEENGWIYFAYSADEEGVSHTRIMRARLEDHQLVDQEVIYSPPEDQFTRAGQHFGCRLAFDGQGHLFFTIGDRGVMQEAQNLERAQGKTHRIRDDGTIPADNPFVDTPGALPTIWTYGNRNAQGLRFHPETGDLWETEHGPRGGDELNLLKKGANYGWPLVTHGINYNGTPITDKTSAPGMEDPVIDWTPSIAVCGLEVYSGKLFPAWKGNLFATALAQQKLVRIELDGQKAVHQEVLLPRTGRIRHVREGRDGTLYLLYEKPGRVVALRPAS